MDNDFATGYALGQSDSGSHNNGGMFGGDWGGLLAILVIAALFGGGFGFGTLTCSFLGGGKVAELKELIENEACDLAIFDNDLSPSQALASRALLPALTSTRALPSTICSPASSPSSRVCATASTVCRVSLPT